MNRAYSVVHLKNIDSEQRVVEGLCSTPSVDRAGDEVLPLGCHFSLPLPALLFHDAENPVATVEWIKPNADGIPFRMRFPAAGLLANVDSAWKMVREGLIRAVSIGFRSIKSEPIRETAGTRFLEWELLEISLVSIPANESALITSIKSYDAPYLRALSGARPRPIVPLQTLAELEKEFSTSTTMTPAIYAARKTAILERAALAPAPVAPTPAPAATLDDPPVTRKFFEMVLKPVIAAVGKAMKEESRKLEARINEVQTRNAQLIVRNDGLERRLSRHAEHLNRLETRMKSMEQK